MSMHVPGIGIGIPERDLCACVLRTTILEYVIAHAQMLNAVCVDQP